LLGFSVGGINVEDESGIPSAICRVFFTLLEQYRNIGIDTYHRFLLDQVVSLRHKTRPAKGALHISVVFNEFLATAPGALDELQSSIRI
jgi:hypothetical protein